MTNVRVQGRTGKTYARTEFFSSLTRTFIPRFQDGDLFGYDMAKVWGQE
jgi:hypothetical protein